MKKFTVIGLIVAAIMAGAGLLFCGISSMTGGYQASRELMKDGHIVHGKWHIGPGGIWYGDDENDDWDDWDDDDWDDVANAADAESAADAENAADAESAETKEGTMTQNTAVGEAELFPVSEIRNIEFVMGAVELVVKENEDSENISVQLLRGKERYYKTGLKDGVLRVSYGENVRGLTVNNKHAVVRILIPAGCTFDDVDIEIGAGTAKIEMSDIACRELDIEVGAGILETDGFTVTDEMDIYIGAGEVIIGGGEYQNADIECGVGNFEMKGTVNHDLSAECGMGNMEIRLNGSEEEYNYTMECSMGNLAVNGKSYAGFAGEQNMSYPGAKGTIDLSCSMGNLELYFE